MPANSGTIIIVAWNNQLYTEVVPDTFVRAMIVFRVTNASLSYIAMHGGTEEIEFACETGEQVMEVLAYGHPDIHNGRPPSIDERYIYTVNADDVVIHTHPTYTGRRVGGRHGYSRKYHKTSIVGPTTVEEAMNTPFMGCPKDPEFFISNFTDAEMPMKVPFVRALWDHGNLREAGIYARDQPPQNDGREALHALQVVGVRFDWSGKGLHRVQGDRGGYIMGPPTAWDNKVVIVRRFTVEDAIWVREFWRPEHKFDYTFDEWLRETGYDNDTVESVKAVFLSALAGTV